MECYMTMYLSQSSRQAQYLSNAQCPASRSLARIKQAPRPALTSHMLHGTHSIHGTHGTLGVYGIFISSLLLRFSSAHTSMTIGTCAMVGPLEVLGGAIPIAAQASGSTFHCESFAFPSLTATSLIFASIAALDVTLSK